MTEHIVTPLAGAMSGSDQERSELRLDCEMSLRAHPQAEAAGADSSLGMGNEEFEVVPVLPLRAVFGLLPVPGAEGVIDLSGLEMVRMGEPSIPRDCVTLYSVFWAYINDHCVKHTRDAARAAQALSDWRIALGLEFDCKTLTRAHGRIVVRHLEGRGLGDGSVRRIMTVGIAALNHAKKEGRIDKVPHFQMPAPASPRQRVYTREEQAKLMALPKPRRIQLYLHVSFETGARAEAVEELEWSRCDLERRIIDFRVPGAVYRNKRRAVVPISDTLYRRLVAAKAYRDANCPDDPYVIGRSPRGGNATTYHLMHALVREAGIDERGVCRHTIRHTVATRLLEAGVAIHKVAQFLGDRVATIEKNYAHVRPIALLDCTNGLREP